MNGPDAALPGSTAIQTAPTGKAFRRAVVRGFVWLGTTAFVGQFVSWLSTILVIRLLAPSDYGLMATTTVFTSFIAMLGELGFGAALIQAKDLGERDIRQAFGWVIVTSLAAWATCVAAAPAIAHFFGQPELVALIRVMAFTIVAVTLYIVPQSLTSREMHFSLKARVEFISQLAGALAALAIAASGLGVWSLVAGVMAQQIAKAVGYHYASPRFFMPLFALRGSGRLFRYGATTTAERILYFAFSYSDTVIIGRFLGASALGAYSVALSLAETPMSKVLPIVTQVSFTSYARIQDDPERLQRNVLRAARVIALAAFPLFFGMAAVAPVAVPMILGERWAAAVLPFQLLCLILPLKALWPILSPAVAAIGRPGVNLSTMAAMAVTLSVALLIGVRAGLTGVCLAWLTAYPIVFLIATAYRVRTLGVGMRRYLAELAFPFIASAAMLTALYLLNLAVVLPGSMVTLAVNVVCGVGIYAALVWTFKRQDYEELRSLLRA